MARRSPRTAGSIRKLASGRYQARWWDDALRRRVPAPTTFGTKSDASRWLAQKESGLFEEPEVEEELAPVVPTLRSYADDWMVTRTLRPGPQALRQLSVAARDVPGHSLHEGTLWARRLVFAPSARWLRGSLGPRSP